MQIVLLKTDVLFFVLLALAGTYVLYARRHEHLVAPWRQVAERPLGMAAAVVLTRRLTRTETLTCILFWMFLMQTILGVFFVALDGHVPIPSLAALPWLFLVALGGLVAHFCLTTALAIAPASVVLPIDFARLPLIAVIGALLYAEIVDIWVFVGAAVIFAANYTNIIIESRAGRAPRPVV